MPRTNRRRFASRVGIFLVVLSVCGFLPSAHPADRSALVVAPDRVPFELSRRAVSKEAPLEIGDLSVASATEASTLIANAIDDAKIERCLAAGPKWLSRSADGTTLELLAP